jgi:protein-S-isoprenylcysteine O-methyltransferase Ste14
MHSDAITTGAARDDFRRQPAARRALLRGILWLVGYMLLLAACICFPTGFAWTRGWVFLAVYLLLVIVSFIFLWRVNPEIVVARSAYRQPAKWWDVIIFAILFLSFILMFPLAALDDGSLHWSSVPLWVTIVGYLLFALGMAASTWVLSVNKFAEPTVRIQSERHHKVIDTGPYAIVRHPLYATVPFLGVGIPLALGSYWALIPAAIALITLVIRTAAEDRLLHEQLDGYREYAARVRYRLFPGVW